MNRFLVPLMALPLLAAPPAGYVRWSASQLKGVEQKLGGQKTGIEHLKDFGTHSTLVVHREATGDAEQHQTMVDIMLVEDGSGTLVVGGEMEKGRTTGPGEIRGPSIKGGFEQKIAVGDVIHIPADTPHQVKLSSGQKITYFVVKCKAQ